MFAKVILRSVLAVSLLAVNPLGMLAQHTQLTASTQNAGSLLVSTASAKHIPEAQKQETRLVMRQLTRSSQKILAKFEQTADESAKKVDDRISKIAGFNFVLKSRLKDHYKKWLAANLAEIKDHRFASSVWTPMALLAQLEHAKVNFDEDLFVTEATKLLQDHDWYLFRAYLLKQEPELAKSGKLDLGYVFDTAKKSVPASSPALHVGTGFAKTFLGDAKTDERLKNAAFKSTQYIFHSEFSADPRRVQRARNDLEASPVSFGIMFIIAAVISTDK